MDRRHSTIARCPRKCSVFFLAFAHAFLIAAAARAAAISNWNVVLTDSVQSGLPGTTLVYSGAISNDTGQTLFLDTALINLAINAPSETYITDLTDDFISTLGIIPTSGYKGSLFFIKWLPTAPTDAFGTGSFELTALGTAEPSVMAVPFVASTTVPEPNTCLLSGAVVLTGIGVKLIRLLARRPVSELLPDNDNSFQENFDGQRSE